MAQVLAEIFPAEVELPDGRFLRKAKIYITDDGVVVLEQTGKTIEIAYRGHHIIPAEMPNPRKVQRQQTMTATTIDGKVTARGALGCACQIRELQRFTYNDLIALSSEGERIT